MRIESQRLLDHFDPIDHDQDQPSRHRADRVDHDRTPPSLHCGRTLAASAIQCLTMPDCESVNEVNTPTT